MPGRFLFGQGITSRGGVRASKSTERPFMFQKVPEIGTFPVPFFPAWYWGLFLVADSPQRSAAKEAGMITLKIKRITRVFNRPPNAIQSIPGLAVLGKRQVGDLCIGSESSTLIGGIDWHVFRFGEEVQAFEQYSSTWSVLPYDEDVPGATKPSTYVSFVFRYRSPGISSRNLSWFRE